MSDLSQYVTRAEIQQMFDEFATKLISQIAEMFEQQFAEHREYIDRRFAEQDARIDKRFTEQDARIDERFRGQDSRMESIQASIIEQGQSLKLLAGHTTDKYELHEKRITHLERQAI
jgi:hypothetical protein